MDYSKLNMAVVGDVGLDIWLRGTVERLSPEAPVPVNKNPKEEHGLAMAGNLAKHIVSLGAECSLFGFCGCDDAGENIILWLEQFGICNKLISTILVETTRKIRSIGNSHYLGRIDYEQSIPTKAYEHVNWDFADFDAVLISDYNKGCMAPGIIEKVLDNCSKNGVPIMVDPKMEHIRKYAKTEIIKLNEHEESRFIEKFFWIADGINQHDRPKYIGVELCVTNVVTTLADKGGRVFRHEGYEMSTFKAIPIKYIDRTGAGDAFMAVLCLEYLVNGNDIVKAVDLARYAGALCVTQEGTGNITVENLKEFIDEHGSG